jgi:hypothetical protein
VQSFVVGFLRLVNRMERGHSWHRPAFLPLALELYALNVFGDP